MVRHKRSPVPSAPQNDESGWQGTLFLRPTTQEDSPPLDEPCTEPVMMADSSSPPSQLANASGERRNMNWDQRRGGNAHPLHGHPGLEPFNDMQILIIDAIAEVGEPASFDQILQSVSSRWRGIKIRRRDGTPYTTDCRRAIQANLRTNPHQVSLFVRVVIPDGSVAWRFSQSIEEAEEAKLKSKSEKVKEVKPSEQTPEDPLGVRKSPATTDPDLVDERSLSDNDSHPTSPDSHDYSRSTRPLRTPRHSGALDDFLCLEDERYDAATSGRSHARSRRDSVSSSYTDTYSHDSGFLRNKQQIRREYMDDSDVPPAKRFSLGSLDHDALEGAPLSSSVKLNHNYRHSSPVASPTQHMGRSRGWTSASPSALHERTPESPSPSPSSSLNIPSVLNLSAFSSAPMQSEQNSSSNSFSSSAPNWLSPSMFGYYQSQAAAAAAAAAAYNSATSVPQFLPHQMSLAHDHAQQVLSGGDSPPNGFSGAWSDRSSVSRHSISSSSSSRTSASTLPDQSPRTPMSTNASSASMVTSPGAGVGLHPAFATLPPTFNLYSAASSMSALNSAPNTEEKGAPPSFQQGTLSH